MTALFYFVIPDNDFKFLQTISLKACFQLPDIHSLYSHFKLYYWITLNFYIRSLFCEL